MKTIGLIDYGMGNLHSAAKALEHVSRDCRIVVSSDPAVICAADKVVFPGVGAMRDCMHELQRLELDAAIQRVAADKPLLAICVGMQALMESSEENDGVDCLGLLPGRVRKFQVERQQRSQFKIPHMGWNQVHQQRSHPLWRDIPQDARFYFVHSYYVDVSQPDLVAATTDYVQPFSSALVRDNLFAVQFHPEKSQRHGLQLLANFVDWNGND